MLLYQGKIKLNKADYDQNNEIIAGINAETGKVNDSVYQTKGDIVIKRNINLLAGALTCFAVAGLVAAYAFGG
jgi:hypothetical protein